MANSNPTSRTGQDGHGSACKKKMHVQQSHLGRYHRACRPKNATRKSGSCKIAAGTPPPEPAPEAQ